MDPFFLLLRAVTKASKLSQQLWVISVTTGLIDTSYWGVTAGLMYPTSTSLPPRLLQAQRTREIFPQSLENMFLLLWCELGKPESKRAGKVRWFIHLVYAINAQPLCSSFPVSPCIFLIDCGVEYFSISHYLKVTLYNWNIKYNFVFF